MRVRLRLGVLAGAAVALAAPQRAPAAADLLRIAQDDRMVVDGTPGQRARTLDEMRATGVDVVRLMVIWRRVAADGGWGPYDDAVRAVRARGMRVLATLTTPAPPADAGRLGTRYHGVRQPDPAAFARFARAAGERWPEVDLWALVNEPNSPRHLGPQWSDGRMRSPALYRALVHAGLDGLVAAGHDPRSVLIGEQLAIGHRRRGPASPIRPVAFARELFCLGARNQPVRGARHPGCGRRLRPIIAGGWSFHPYHLLRGPRTPPPHPDDVTPTHLDRLLRVLRSARRLGRFVAPAAIWDTEGGIQSRPPEPAFGVSLARQAAVINETEWLLWRNPVVRSHAQYLWRDDPHRNGFQTGLRFRDGRRKPALAAYRLPLYVRRGRRRVLVWGRVPPAGARTAELLLPGGAVRRVAVAADDHVAARVPLRRGTYRLRWEGRLSRPVRLGRRRAR